MAITMRRRRGEVTDLTASAEVIEVGPKTTRNRRSSEWQKEAWGYYDNVPEIWFGMNYIANALRRVRLFPATWPDPSQAPVPIDPDTPLGVQAYAELDRLRGDDGSFGDIVHDAAMQLSIPGEGLFGMWDDPDTKTEVAGVYSIDELTLNTEGAWVLKGSESDNQPIRIGTTEEDNVLVSRLWRPHPRFRTAADSAMRPLLKTCHEAELLDRLYRSNARSRVSAGMLLVPDAVRLRDGRRAGETTGFNNVKDPFVRAMLVALATPLQDEESAGNVAPGVIKVKGDLIEQFRHLTFGRDFDENTAKRYDRVLRRIATGLDLPPEVLTGIENLNHWSAWLISEDAFDTHLAPLLQTITSAFTKVFFIPAMGAQYTATGEPLVVWFDPSALISHPNKGPDADSAFDRAAISWEAYRRYKGYGEADAPDEEELAERERLGLVKNPNATTATQGPPQGAAHQPLPVPPPPTITASAAVGRALGLELAKMDRELRIRLQAACEGAVVRALEKSGAKMRRKVAGTPFKATIDGVPNTDVCRVLGRDVVRRYFDDDTELLDDAVDPVLPVYNRLVAQAQAELRRKLDAYTDSDLDDDPDVEAEQDADRERGAAALRALLIIDLAAMLYSPHHEAPSRGEVDDTFRIPAGTIRGALAVAGGAPTPTREHVITGNPQGGVATGETSQALCIRIGLTPTAWVWVYGDEGSRRTSFQGHLDLDGVEFSDWQDEKLAVQAGDEWIGERYSPGDHSYCQCDFAPVMTETNQEPE